jgi:VWFA-related protein
MTKEYAIGSNYLRSLAEKTGGRIYNADNLSDLPAAFNAITEELGRQYSLGYYPKSSAQAGETRDIKVRTRQPNLIVRARESYVATANGSHAGGQ